MNNQREEEEEDNVSTAAAAEPAEVTAAQDTPPAPITDADGGFTPDWYARYEELQPYAASLAKFKRPEALAKSYAHLERLKGYPDIADTRRMAGFREAVGLPATAEEYAIARPEDMPDEAWDDDLMTALAQVAYEYGVPPKAMDALAQRYAGESRRMLEACERDRSEAVERADAELQEEWGRDYDDNMRIVGDFLHHLGNRAGVDVQQLTESPALQASSDFARLMLAAASLLQEAPLRAGSPAAGKDEAHRIAHDPAHPLHEAYMRTNHPQHRYANEQYDRLAFGRQL